MENFYLVNYQSKLVKYPFLYSNGSILTRKDKKLFIDDIYVSDDTFSTISFFINFEHEFLIVENLHNLFLINKHTLNITDLGTFKDEIKTIANNLKFTLVVTCKSLLLFSNEYFDVIGEIDNPGDVLKVEFSTDNTFVLIFDDKIVFYNVEMTLLSKHNIVCLSACYIERYNYWCVVSHHEITFIEENGCVYNKISLKESFSIEKCYSKDFLLLLACKDSVIILQLVDGNWRTKHICKIRGRFISYYNDIIISETDDSLFYYFINREYTRIGNLFLVIDYNSILVYNFDKNKLACHDFLINFKKPIQRIMIDREEIGILFDNEMFIFSIDFNLLEKKQNMNKFYNGICMFNKQIICSEEDINMHNIDGKILRVSKNGEIYMFEDNNKKTVLFTYSSISKEYFLMYVNNELYFLSDNTLYTSTHKISSVFSFYVSDILIYSKEDKIFIDDTYIVTDTNFKILGTTDLEIFGISRFNSIDTYYNRNFIKKQISKYFLAEEYTKSIDMMLKHNIKIELININTQKIKELENKYLFFIIDEITKDYKLVLDSEFIFMIQNMTLCTDLSAIKCINEKSNSAFIFKDTWISTQNLFEHKIENCFNKKLVSFVKGSSVKIECKKTELIQEFLNIFGSDIREYIFIKCGRIDLAILYSKNLDLCIKMCKNYFSKEEIKIGLILCYKHKKDLNLVKNVCKLINEDVYLINDIENDFYKILEIYKLYDELIYYFIEQNMYNDLCRVVKKYNLYKKLLIYIIILENPAPFNLLELYISGSSINDNIWILQYLKYEKRLLDLYLDNDMYKEIFLNESADKYKQILINNLKNKNKFYELGIIYEQYIKDYEQSLSYFVQSGSIADIYRLYKISSIKPDLFNVSIKQYTLIDKILKKLIKYKNRLKCIQNDLEDDDFSVTSICQTNRGIPGNLYEYEFYLEKINGLLAQIVKWIKECQMILEIYYNADLKLKIEEVKQEIIGIEDFFNVSYERSKDKIECLNFYDTIN